MQKIISFIINRYKLILIISLVVFAFSLLGTSKLKINSSMDEMLPSDSEALIASKNFEKYFESQDNAIVVVQGETEKCKLYMEDIENSIKEKNIANKTLYKIDTKEFGKYGLLFLDKPFYNNLDSLIESNDLIQINELIQQAKAQNNEDEVEYMSNENKDTFMMIIKPEIDQANFVESRDEFYNGIKGIISSTLAKDEYENLDSGLTGGSFVQDIEADTVAFDGFGSTLAITIVLIILLVVLSFKKILIPFSVVYPLLLGALVASSIGFLIYGSLNMFSVSFALLLVGLGIDFAVHLISRYFEEKQRNNTVVDSIKISLKETGISIIAGAITTAVAFLAFIFAKFKAFEQMGIISAIGIIVLCTIMLFVVPTLALLIDSKKKPSTTNKKKTSFAFLKRIGEFIQKHPISIVVGIVILVPLLFVNVMNTKVIGDMDKIYPDNMPSKKWEEVVKKEFDYNPNVLTFMVEDEKALNQAVNELSGRDDIESIDSAYKYMPEDQTYKLEVIEKLNTSLLNAGVEPPEEFNIAKMTVYDLPEVLRSNYVGQEGRLLVEVVPSVNIYEAKHYNPLKETITEASGGNSPVGMPSIMNEIIEIVKNDILLICIICFIAIIILVGIIFKSFKDILICVIPVMITLYLTIGFIPLLGNDINVFSIMAFPLIIGIGIDSSIHLMHRLKEDYDKGIGFVLMHTGKAIILTSLTSILGFGSLTFINHPGMSNLGSTVATGLIICIVLTLTFIPATYVLTHKRNEESEIENKNTEKELA